MDMTYQDEVDMVGFTVFGKKCAELFSVGCLESIQDFLDSGEVTAFDYNFLLGVKQGLQRRSGID